MIAEPPGLDLRPGALRGLEVVFDAHGEGRSTADTSDIYAISASATPVPAAFPQNATNLTRNAAADNIEPAWTSAAAPLVALGRRRPPGLPATIDAAAILAGR